MNSKDRKVKAIPKPKKKRNISDEVLDGLVRKYIRLISGGYCKRCGRYVGIENIEVAHMYRRRRKTVRWDLRNVYPLCRDNPATGKQGCHSIVDNSETFHKASFLRDVMTEAEIAELDRIANMTLKEYPIDREQIKTELKEKIKMLEGNRT